MSLKISLQLEGKSVSDRCVALDRFFNAVLEEKGNRNEFLQEFPTLIEDVFISSKEKRAWIISQIREDYDALLEMLKPESRFFQLLFKFGSGTSYRYEFPMARLPESYKYIFTSGVKLPPFFGNKVNLLKKSVSLNILEYYIFLFCYAVTLPLHDELVEEEQKRAKEEQHDSPGWTDKFYSGKKADRKFRSDNCYINLLQQYLDMMMKQNDEAGPGASKVTTYTGHFDARALRNAYFEAITIFWLGQNTPERTAKEIFVAPTNTVVSFLIETVEKLVKSIKFFRVRKGAPLSGPQDEVLYGLMLTLSKSLYLFLKLCFQRANKMPDKMDYAGLVQVWQWFLKPFHGVTEFTSKHQEETPSKSWSKMKSFFSKTEEDGDSAGPVYPPEIQSVLDAVNQRVVRPHVHQHVPFYTVLLLDFVTHAQNHAKNESDRRDILEVFRCIEPSPANKIIEYVNEAARVLDPSLSTPVHNSHQLTPEIDDVNLIRTRTAELESEMRDPSLELCRGAAKKLISVIKSVKVSSPTSPKAEDIISAICHVFDIKDGGKSIPIYGQVVPLKAEGDQSSRIDYAKCYDDKGELTEYGRDLVRRGLLHRSIDDIGYRGAGPKPIKSDEIYLMARLSFRLSELLFQATGQRYDLRFMASRMVWAFTIFAVVVCAFFGLVLYLAITAASMPVQRQHYTRPR